MSKVLSGLLLAGLLGAGAQADLLRVEAGAGAWQNDFSGSLSSGTPADVIESDILGYEKETKGYAWLNIKHPVPILPNLRLEYAAVDFSGTSTSGFTYKDKDYNANSQSDLTLDQIDVIMYYNILDNTAWVTLDLGLDIKVIQAEFNAVGTENITNNSLSLQEKETLPIPMAYGRMRFEIPGVDIGVEGNVKYIGYKDSKVMDYAIKADYTLVDVLPIDVGLEVGYRFQQLDIDGSDFSTDTSFDIEVDGVFAGATVKF
jgi:outer membrane protein